MKDIAIAVRQAVKGKRPNSSSSPSAGNSFAEWGELIPLAAVPAVPPFPVDVLPSALVRFAEEVAASIPCPVDYVAVPMLAIAGASIGASRALEIKPGQTERPCIYAAVVGPPSCGKTPCLGFAARPLHDEQARLYEIYRRERQAHEAGVEDATKPTENVKYVSDVTTEKLAGILQENPRGVAVVRDELTGWVRSMDQYKSGKGADRQFWLSTWSGDPVSVHRKTQDAGPVRVPHPFVAVIGGLPPDLLASMRGERAVRDGFMDRLLFAYPEPLPARGESWLCVAEESLAAWREALAALWDLRQENDLERGPRPHFVRLTSCGRKAWERFTSNLAGEMNHEHFPDCLRGPWGKTRSYGARLALIVHQLRLVHGEAEGEDVDGQSVDHAAELVRYFHGHARKVYAEIDADPRIAEARRVLHWIEANGLHRFTKRDAHQALRGTFKTVEEMASALTLMEKHGYIRAEQAADRAGPGRKPSPVYEVHPGTFELNRE